MTNTSIDQIAKAQSLGLMHGQIVKREGKQLLFHDGSKALEFANCSYFGLDQDSRLLSAAKQAIDRFGIHICVARSRFVPSIHTQLESELSKIFKASTITFPSVSTAHLAVLPVLARELKLKSKVIFAFDQFAHASMQSLKTFFIGQDIQIKKIPHNDTNALESLLRESPLCKIVYLCDGLYSMGGKSPVLELKELQNRYPQLFLYIDDAHGTSIHGKHGKGYALKQLNEINSNTIVCFSLAKGFGCNGGGIAIANAYLEKQIRYYSSPYAFSGPLEYAGTGAALASTEIHLSDELDHLQKQLKAKVRLFDQLTGQSQEYENFNPVRPVLVGDTGKAIEIANTLKSRGYFVPVAFFPVVKKDQALLRVVISRSHANEDIHGLATALSDVLKF